MYVSYVCWHRLQQTHTITLWHPQTCNKKKQSMLDGMFQFFATSYFVTVIFDIFKFVDVIVES